MICTVYFHNELIPKSISDLVINNVFCALESVTTVEDKFIINDTDWYWLNQRDKIMPTAVNSAQFISKRFLKSLEANGWSSEKTIAGQTIDSFIEVEIEGEQYSLSEGKFLPLLNEMRNSGVDNYGRLSTYIFENYVQRKNPIKDEIVSTFESFFTITSGKKSFQIGLEFETGNIASSFRAITKLDGLYKTGKIDVGVFITSHDKANCSHRIWPPSNRNGSFQELDNRHYQNSRSYPAIDISFKPDGFDKNAEYLRDDGTTYKMDVLGTVELDGGKYEKADAKGRLVYRPLSQLPLNL